MYYSMGPWKWGLNSSSTVYLLLLSVVFYFFWRTRRPTLARGRIRVFRELIENMHLTKRYDELVLLVEPQLPKLILLTKQPSLISGWIDRLKPPTTDIATLLREEPYVSKPLWQGRLNKKLELLKAKILARDNAGTQAREVLLNLVTSPELTDHLAIAHPHFCLKLIEADEAVRADFIDNYMDALLGESGSRLYVELKNNQNINVGSRLELPKYNRLLYFFFSDAAMAMKNGLYSAIGEAVCRRLDEDHKLIDKLNEQLGSYYDSGRFRCPINSGITLFEIMVHEGIHQGLQDHMWLHYFWYFTKKILKQIPVRHDNGSHEEWPTPFHYLLYRLISVATDWAKQSARIDDKEIPEATRNANDFDRYYISKQATIVLGSMLHEIMPSNKLSCRFKTYLLGVAVRSHIALSQDLQLTSVANMFTTAVIRGIELPTETSYKLILKRAFDNLDHIERFKAAQFKQALDESLA